MIDDGKENEARTEKRSKFGETLREYSEIGQKRRIREALIRLKGDDIIKPWKI